MAALRNTRWENYARARALLALGPSAAYMHIGGTGNPRKQSEKLEVRPQIQQRMQELHEEAKERLIQKQLYTKETVIRGLLENIDEARNQVKTTPKGDTVYLKDHAGNVAFDEHGEPIPVMDRDHTSINRAWELLGIELGMFPKHATLEHRKQDPFDGMSVEEILGKARDHFINELGWDVGMSDLLSLVERVEAEDGASDPAPNGAEQPGPEATAGD